MEIPGCGRVSMTSFAKSRIRHHMQVVPNSRAVQFEFNLINVLIRQVVNLAGCILLQFSVPEVA